MLWVGQAGWGVGVAEAGTGVDVAKAKIQLGEQFSVHPKNALLAQLKQLCGEECVKVGY